ncbi:hypothetical protein Ahy_B06g082135 [Arachis hypogaea]|uniref:THO1-MOS11 C-terminal domain-containing protein n=1 Tax=Arachis hypogaea TaxID=3818 RepID=A0A444YN04_ARAHY|nr:hypothetical protein Ahy_B06g082135 [Arachis hypogaea]
MATTTDNPNPNPTPTNPPQQDQNPNKTLDPAPATAHSDADPSVPPPSADNNNTTAPDSKDAPLPSDAANDAPLSDIQKKIRRAERFGISVQLSEKEKRNSRAERFGTGSTTVQGTESSKSEELKRKARAERFGMPSPASSADEEAKKKARLARFAPASKVDPVEEDKRKARAERFSNQSSGSLTQVNGEGKIEPLLQEKLEEEPDWQAASFTVGNFLVLLKGRAISLIFWISRNVGILRSCYYLLALVQKMDLVILCFKGIFWLSKENK